MLGQQGEKKKSKPSIVQNLLFNYLKANNNVALN